MTSQSLQVCYSSPCISPKFLTTPQTVPQKIPHKFFTHFLSQFHTVPHIVHASHSSHAFPHNSPHNSTHSLSHHFSHFLTVWQLLTHPQCSSVPVPSSHHTVPPRFFHTSPTLFYTLCLTVPQSSSHSSSDNSLHRSSVFLSFLTFLYSSSYFLTVTHSSIHTILHSPHNAMCTSFDIVYRAVPQVFPQAVPPTVPHVVPQFPPSIPTLSPTPFMCILSVLLTSHTVAHNSCFSHNSTTLPTQFFSFSQFFHNSFHSSTHHFPNFSSHFHSSSLSPQTVVNNSSRHCTEFSHSSPVPHTVTYASS